MTTVSELWGRSGERTQHWWVFVGGYALVVFSLLLVAALGEESGFADTFLLPAALFYAPPFVAAASAFHGGGFPASLAVGLAPGVLFALVVGGLDLVGHTAPGEAPIWALAVGFGLLGVIGALLGFGVSKGMLRFVEAR
jgi:hypothetical protein